MQKIRILTAGDSSLLIEFGKEICPETNRKISATVQLMREQHIEGVVDVIPAFCSLLINYDPRVISYKEIRKRMQALLKVDAKAGEQRKRVFEIPVCYGGEYGPDIDYVAQYNHLSVEEVIAIHTEPEYLVYMIGFCPGFPYLGGMDKRIATPRRDTPRVAIPACSIGIAGEQTGGYPLSTPGGWQIIGRTPMDMFSLKKEDDPSLLHAGDIVKFYAVSEEEFAALKEEYGHES